MVRESDEINESLYGAPKRKNKYGVAKKEDRTADNIVFDSRREMLHYLNLRLLVRAGTITNLELQPSFPLIVNGQTICRYVADFRFSDLDGRDNIHDVKGARTALYILKYKLFHACWPALRIIEV